MDLPPKEPVGTGGLVGDEETQCGSRTGESLGTAEDMAGVAVESLVPFAPTSKDAGCSKAVSPGAAWSHHGSLALLQQGAPAALESVQANARKRFGECRP